MVLNKLVSTCIAGIVCFIVSIVPAQAVTVSTVAGTGIWGHGDGTSETAMFKTPNDVVPDGVGNVFVTESFNSRIRKIDAAGNVTTLAGGLSGYADGPGAVAKFRSPNGIAIDGAGNLYVADTGNHRIRKIDAAGNVTTLAGNGTMGYADGPGATAKFYSPVSVTVDRVGNLYVADYHNSCIRKIDAAGYVTTLAGRAGNASFLNGNGGSARFKGPHGVAVDSVGNVFVADYGNGLIRKIDAAANVTTLAGVRGTFGFKDGGSTTALFRYPVDVEVDAAGNVFVADDQNNRIRKIDAAGNVTTLAGISAEGWVDGPGAQAMFDSPLGVGVDDAGNVFVADASNNRIRKINYQTSPPPLVSQSISFAALPTIAVGSSNTLSATGGASGNSIVFSSTTPTICTVTGNTVTGIALGTCTVAANQAGNASYSAAPQVTQSFEVQSTVPAAPVIGVAVAGNAQATISFTPPTNDGGAAITSYTVTSLPDGITATGTGSPIVVTGLVNGTTYTFTVTATNSVGTSLPSAPSNAVTPVKADQAITFATAPTLFVAGTGTVSASADSGLVVGYTSLTPATCTVAGNTVTGIAPGTCTIAADQAGDAYYNAAPQVTQSFEVQSTVPAAPVIGVAVAGNAQATISFTPPTNDGGAAITSYTVTSLPDGITATGTGSPIVVTGLVNGTTYTFTVTATNSVGTSLPSVTSNAVTPVKADQVITFAAAPTLFVAGTGTVSASADSGLVVGYTSLTPATCTVAGNTVIGIAPGTCTIAADQAGDAYYNAAPQVTQSFEVQSTVPAAPVIGVAVAGNAQATISFTPPTNDGGAAITSYTVTSLPDGITATGTGSPIVVTGLVNGTSYTFTVTATNSVGTSLPSASSNAVTPKADQTITFTAASALFVGGTGTVSATVDSGLAVGFTSLTPATCTVTGNTVTGIAPGTCTIAADQAGDVYYNAAPQVTLSFEVENQIYDFNLDGKSDILWRNPTSGENMLWFMNGASINSSAAVAATAVAWEIAGVGDFDGDGKADILWGNSKTGENVVWLMDGAAMASSGTLATTARTWVVAGVGDFDGDGKADILWSNSKTGENAVWLMDGTTMSSSGALATTARDWVITGVGDLDGDGKADILWGNSKTGENMAWLMNGTTMASAGALATTAREWAVVGMGDFDGDGKADILWSNSKTGENAVWLMNGATMSGSGVLAMIARTWAVAGIGDYNGDGNADILWSNSATGQGVIWLMDGATMIATGVPGTLGKQWEAVK